MKPTPSLFFGLMALLVPLGARASEQPAFDWHDGDRVVLIGDTLVERSQKTSYLETLITAQNPTKTIVFRNLGWSGDTALGLSRARFGPPAEGFAHLKEHVLALKPSVLIVGYGMAESFDGEAGLSPFVANLNALLDSLAETKARLIFLSPIAHEDLGKPLPDPSKHNADLIRYRDAIKTVADERKGWFLDLYEPTLSAADYGIGPLTDNGIHLSPYGEWYLSSLIDIDLRKSKRDASPWDLRINASSKQVKAIGASVTGLDISAKGARFTVKSETLPATPPPAKAPPGVVWMGSKRALRVSGLEPGHYLLKIDGKTVATGDEGHWAKGVPITTGPEFDQLEKLRSAIVAKNLLYFYRWRPQNETYLFGFRKHEQGNNAIEIPKFDPLIDARENEIKVLKVAVPHVYELTLESEVGR